MEKNIILVELLNAAFAYMEDPTSEAKQKEFEDFKGRIAVKEFLSLGEKEIALLRIGYGTRRGRESTSASYSTMTEFSLVINGLLAYTNIDNSMQLEADQYDAYDVIFESGLYDFILGFCEKDYNRLERMHRQMISFDNLERLVDTFDTLDSEKIEELTEVIHEFKKNMDTQEMTKMLEAMVHSMPVADALQKTLDPELLKTLDLGE